MNHQTFFNLTCNSLRTYGNAYGSTHERGWNWINPNNPKERCAIARFVSGSDDAEVMSELAKLLNIKFPVNVCNHSLVGLVVELFDYSPYIVNHPAALEFKLKEIADILHLDYPAPTKTIVKEEVKVVDECLQ